ncbi:MAG: SprT-like domain-containing protein [Chitinophagaceae bacterium]
MPKKEIPLEGLAQYLPPDTLPVVLAYLKQYKVHLTIARERASVLGDYRHRTIQKNHRISVNGNLNVYAFLLTFLHELAHLICYESHGNKVSSHGKEWKKIYGDILSHFVQQQTFPDDIEREVLQSLRNPAASSCAEENLMRVLRRYDKRNGNHCLVEEIAANALFKTKDGRIFKKGQQLRKRFQCVEIQTGKMYLFSPVYEVKLVEV